ncbi:MAG TPA: sn-glycerol-3-phosphate ABC transporter ATP-binding protein UgpC [Gaiellaceae bacterium]|nr:sn-glycerol-3-phosphate ABC transporter ATP-binding protein UgpC [Gaiellaceae bacterium]
MAELSYAELTKVFDEGTVAVERLSLDVEDGEFLVFVGPSGCGKTTTLMMTAGLEEPTSGEVLLGGEAITYRQPKDRDIAMVFQSYALYPHMTVEDNIAFGLRRRRMAKPEIQLRVREAAQKLDLEGLLHRKPGTLSGGQRQRVAMGRAMVRRPQLFLMDEPLSNLDAKLRVQMRAEIKQLQRELGVTTMYVTHDQTEAMTMGDRIAVMRKGVLEQLGKPSDLYQRPRNVFVAEFIGSPAMNLVRGRLQPRDDTHAALQLGSSEELVVELPEEPARSVIQQHSGRDVVVGFRPESVSIARGIGAPETTISAVVRHVEDLGSEVIVYFESEAKRAVTDQGREVAADVDDVALETLEHPVSGRELCIGRLAPGAPITVGERVLLGVDPAGIHIFDSETGQALR